MATVRPPGASIEPHEGALVIYGLPLALDPISHDNMGCWGVELHVEMFPFVYAEVPLTHTRMFPEYILLCDNWRLSTQGTRTSKSIVSLKMDYLPFLPWF